MIHGSDNGPACGFYPGTEPSRAGEQVDSELTPGGLLPRAPLFEGLFFGCFWVSRECKRRRALKFHCVRCQASALLPV